VLRSTGYEGWPALFQGLPAGLLATGTAWGVYILSYNVTKRALRTDDEDAFFRRGTWQLHMTAGAVSGTVTLVVTNPLFVVKTRMALQLRHTRTEPHHFRTIPSLVHIVKREGWKGLFRGMVPSAFSVPQAAIQFSVYEQIKARLKALHHSSDYLSSYEYFGAGACSKLISSVIVYPSQVIRSHLLHEESRMPSAWQTLTTIARQDGIVALYKGLSCQLLRVIPQAAIALATYEMILKYLKLSW